MQGAPRYTLDVEANPETKEVTGTGSIVVQNTSSEPWNWLIFVSIPTLSTMVAIWLSNVLVLDGQPANFTYQDDYSSLRVLLPKPLLAGESVTVDMNWKLGYPSWVDDPAVYALFGRSQKMVSLPLFYPAGGAYEAGPAVGSGRWWTDMGTVRGDAALNVISLFEVTATLPSDQVPATSGTLVYSKTLDGDKTAYRWVTGGELRIPAAHESGF